MKLEIDNRRKTKKFTNLQKINNTLISNQYAIEEIAKEIRKHLHINGEKNDIPKLIRCSKSNAKRETDSY